MSCGILTLTEPSPVSTFQADSGCEPGRTSASTRPSPAPRSSSSKRPEALRWPSRVRARRWPSTSSSVTRPSPERTSRSPFKPRARIAPSPLSNCSWPLTGSQSMAPSLVRTARCTGEGTVTSATNRSSMPPITPIDLGSLSVIVIWSPRCSNTTAGSPPPMTTPQCLSSYSTCTFTWPGGPAWMRICASWATTWTSGCVVTTQVWSQIRGAAWTAVAVSASARLARMLVRTGELLGMGWGLDVGGYGPGRGRVASGPGAEAAAEEVARVPARRLGGVRRHPCGPECHRRELRPARPVERLAQVVVRGVVVLDAPVTHLGRAVHGAVVPRDGEDGGHTLLDERELVAAYEHHLGGQRVGCGLQPGELRGALDQRPERGVLAADRDHLRQR